MSTAAPPPPPGPAPGARPAPEPHHAEVHEHHDVQGLHAPIMREQADPRDGFEPVPTWLVPLFGILMFGGGYYMHKYGGDFRGDVFYEERGTAGAGGRAAAGPTLTPVQLGQKVWKSLPCAGCHQPEGQGQPGQVPPLAGSEWVVGPPEWPIAILQHGLGGPIEVLGATYNGAMPNLGAKLKDDQLANLVTFLRQNPKWGNDAPPVTAEQVEAVRAATAARTAPWTADELKALSVDLPAAGGAAGAAPTDPAEAKGATPTEGRGAPTSPAAPVLPADSQDAAQEKGAAKAAP